MTLAPQIDTGTRALMQRRLVQFAAMIFAAYFALAIEAAIGGRPQVVATLVCASMMLLACLFVNQRGHSTLANLLLWVSVGAVAAILLWINRGANQAYVLFFPIVLTGASQVLTVRRFVVLLAALLVLWVGISLSIRMESEVQLPARDPGLGPLFQSMIIMALTGGMAWLMAMDMRSALDRLQRQIRQAQESETNLTYLAQHDALTQLPNRALGPQLIEQSIESTRRNGTRMALLFVDLDNFKDINDSLGHAAGDDFLRLVSQRLRTATRKSDIVCRQGGDEFLIGLANVVTNADISVIAKNVLEKITQPCNLRDTEIVASCSIGIAVYPEDGTRFEDLLRHADLAMYHAKEAGRNTFRFYDEDINASVSESLYLIATLRTAITQKEFVLHYQPVLDLRTGALIGAEALIRWQNPKLGLVSPALFIPAAEKSGLIVDIGQWVLEEACRQMQIWKEEGAPLQTIAVNLSPVQFRRGDVEGIIERALKNSGLDPQYLELEVTESTLVQDTEKFIQSLQRIKTLGIRISIDDFGTGYSNLSYLQRFAVDKLKIDQSFVKRLMNGPQELAIVTAIIQMAKSMNLQTNAEGVEDAATRDLLASLGCDQAQGYFYARPLPPERFELFMQQNMGAVPTISPAYAG